MRKIGILTGGGDAPGLNAVIRGVVATCAENNMEVVGFWDGWRGVVLGEGTALTLDDVENIQIRGGTIIGCSRTNIYKLDDPEGVVESTVKRLKLEGIIAIGGDDTLGIACKLHKRGINIIGVPKTIDNDILDTDYTFGYDTAINIATESIDRLHTTADAHSKCMVVEVMGRHTGWIAIGSGIATGAHIVLVPEFKKSVDEICEIVKSRKEMGKNYTIIVVAEGFEIEGITKSVAEIDDFNNVKMDKKEIGPTLAKLIQDKIGINTNCVVLSYLQRGGSPSAFDRILATRFGAKAAELALEKQYGYAVTLKGTEVKPVEIEEFTCNKKLVSEEYYKIANSFYK